MVSHRAAAIICRVLAEPAVDQDWAALVVVHSSAILPARVGQEHTILQPWIGSIVIYRTAAQRRRIVTERATGNVHCPVLVVQRPALTMGRVVRIAAGNGESIEDGVAAAGQDMVAVLGSAGRIGPIFGIVGVIAG